jgi:hypothetical protein
MVSATAHLLAQKPLTTMISSDDTPGNVVRLAPPQMGV